MQRVYVTYNPKTGQIIACYQVNNPNIKILNENTILVNRYPNPREERVYKGTLKPKPYLSITLSKSNISADGIDEIEITAALSECQEDEEYDYVSITIAKQSVKIPLSNNKGSIKFASKVPGKHMIKIDDKRFRGNEETYEVIVDEVNE